MKVTSISVRRNYHLSNDDSYAKGEWSISADVDEGDEVQECYSLLADELDLAFKTRYPLVRTYANFEEVRQVRDLDKCLKEVSDRQQQKIFNPTERPQSPLGTISNEQLKNIIEQSGEPLYKKYDEHPTQKIQKGTIEEQIEACTEIEGKEDYQLESFKLFASTNKKYKEVYNKKLSELMGKKSKLQTT